MAEDRELVVVVGPSGCGGSTLLRMIAGLKEPDEGIVEIAKRDATDRTAAGRGAAGQDAQPDRTAPPRASGDHAW